MYETADFWRGWLNMGEFPDHPWRSHLQRAALTLKGLTYAPTGALIAAPTTSLPETPGGERNWDYRYSWVRDATFALWGLYTLGFDFEANSFFYFIADQVKDGSSLQVMYGVGGENELAERSSTISPATSTPARPRGQRRPRPGQHDVWGALLDSVYLHMRSGEFLTGRMWRGLERQVTRRPSRTGESPIRESGRCEAHPSTSCRRRSCAGSPATAAPGSPRCWTSPSSPRGWAAEADLIKADVLDHGVDGRGVLTQIYGADALDASLLLAPLMRFLPADDPASARRCSRSPTSSRSTAS